MPDEKPYPRKSPDSSKRKQQIVSPFVDEELFADLEAETAEKWASHMDGNKLDSPFQNAFEPEQETFSEPEVDESFEHPPILDESSEEEEDLFDPETEEFYDVGAEVNDEEVDEELEHNDEMVEPEEEEEKEIGEPETDDFEELDEEEEGEDEQYKEDQLETGEYGEEEEELEAENFLEELNDAESNYGEADEILAELLANELDIPETEEYYEVIDKPDDEEVVAEFEDQVLERLNKLTEDQTAIEEESPPPIQPTKEPLAVPVSDPVPFAPPPPIGSYWPVRSRQRRGREVAFRATDGTTVGNRSRAFMSKRTSKKKGKIIKRYHVGIDLYAKHGDPVVACEDGVIVNFHRFLGKTRALVVEHANVVINCGEVASNSLVRTGLKVGSSVKAGQIIGYVGLLPKGSSMLHFETYRKGTTSNKRWYRHKKPPFEILNPTKYLLFLQQNGLVEKDTIGHPVPSAPDTGRSIDLERAVRLNRHYGQKLGWHDYYESIERFLGFTNISPSEETLADAVAVWQRSQGLKPDGIIGQQTWKRMKPALGVAGKTSHTAASPATSSPQIGGQTFGKLVIDTSHPALRKSHPSYQFTHYDAVWLARFVEGEAGGRDDANNHAVIWAMFNRYGVFRHRAPSWGSFGGFIQKYSTTLQPMLKSVGAAKRVWRNNQDNPKKYPVEVGDGYYKDTNIKKVQYKKHILLQQKLWEEFSPTIRNMVTRILTGQISNPGIGIASEFASTRIYYKQHYGKFPNERQWRIFTQKHEKHKWTWVGDVSGINQMKNAFFIVNRLKNVPSSALRVVP